MRLLVVDDSSTMRRIIRNTLERLGHTDVVEAEHGVEAWEKLSADESIKVVITDWNMPEMNGLDLVKKIRDYYNPIHNLHIHHNIYRKSIYQIHSS